MKENTNISFWNRVAFLYTKFMKNNEKIYGETHEKISSHFTEQADVLELACGTGQFSYVLSEQTKSFIATDFSSNMVAETEKNYTGNKATFEVQDATKLIYDDNRFDVVLIANALHVMPNPELAIQEIKRVLKPNGMLIAPTFIYDENISKLRMWFIELIGFRSYSKWNRDQLTSFASQHGFSVVSSEVISSGGLSECILIAQNL